MKKKKMATKEMEKEMLKENQLIFKKLVKKNVEEGKLEAFNLGKREVFISTSEPRWLRDWIKEGAKMGLFKNTLEIDRFILRASKKEEVTKKNVEGETLH